MSHFDQAKILSHSIFIEMSKTYIRSLTLCVFMQTVTCLCPRQSVKSPCAPHHIKCESTDFPLKWRCILNQSLNNRLKYGTFLWFTIILFLVYVHTMSDDWTGANLRVQRYANILMYLNTVPTRSWRAIGKNSVFFLYDNVIYTNHLQTFSGYCTLYWYIGWPTNVITIFWSDGVYVRQKYKNWVLITANIHLHDVNIFIKCRQKTTWIKHLWYQNHVSPMWAPKNIHFPFSSIFFSSPSFAIVVSFIRFVSTVLELVNQQSIIYYF